MTEQSRLAFRDRFLFHYLLEAPMPLAIERAIECEILSRQSFEEPVLDIGCGDGVFASRLFASPIELGVDIDRRELDRALRFSAYRELIHCSADRIPRPDKSFRTIFSNSALEHMPDIEAVLRESHRLLADDGRLYMTVPTHLFDRYSAGYTALSGLGARALAERYRGFYNRFWRHHHAHDQDGWSRVLARCGFRILRHEEYAPLSVCLLNDLLMPFAMLSAFTKRALGRWILFPRLRLRLAPLLAAAAGCVARPRPGLIGGGIIFLAAEKADAR